MNAPLHQSDRRGRLTTEPGPDTLPLLRFDATDYLNELFEYRVETLRTTGYPSSAAYRLEANSYDK